MLPGKMAGRWTCLWLSGSMATCPLANNIKLARVLNLLFNEGCPVVPAVWYLSRSPYWDVNMNKELLINKFLIFLLIIFIYNIYIYVCVFLRQTCTINQHHFYNRRNEGWTFISYSCIEIHLCVSHLDNLSRSFWRCTSAPFNQLSRMPAALFKSWNSLVFDSIQNGSTFFVTFERRNKSTLILIFASQIY